VGDLTRKISRAGRRIELVDLIDTEPYFSEINY